MTETGRRCHTLLETSLQNWFVMPHPKIRGVRRRCSTFARRLAEVTQSFPAPHDERGYWHLHLPAAGSFINSPRTPQSVRRECVQLLVDAALRLIALRPSSVAAPVIMAVITPLLSNSQMIAFFSPDYLASFFDRDEPGLRWTPLPASRSLVREWRLLLPPSFSERGFHEHIHEEDYAHNGEIWFFGELS